MFCTPRDALVATFPTSGARPSDLRQSLDKVGSYLDSLMAIGPMLLWENEFNAVF